MIIGSSPTMYSESDLLRIIREKVDHPATAKELMQLLRLPREARATFKRQLRSFVASGALMEVRGARFGLPDRMNLLVGRISTNPRGFAFVDPESPGDGDPTSIFIAGQQPQPGHARRSCGRACGAPPRPDRAEGRIVRILERGSERIVGRYDLDPAGRGFVVPFDRRLVIDMEIPSGDARGAAAGEMVTAEIIQWPTSTRPATGADRGGHRPARGAGRRHGRHHPQVRAARHAQRGRDCGGRADGKCRPREGPRRPHGLPRRGRR